MTAKNQAKNAKKSKAKVATKAITKPVSKSATKAVVKVAAKPSKPAAKPSPAAKAKPALKPAHKTAPKPAAKAKPPSTPKPSAKVPPKPVVKKTLIAKPVKATVSKTPPKPVAKKAAPAKVVAKPVAKTVAKKVAAPPATKPVKAEKPAKAAAPAAPATPAKPLKPMPAPRVGRRNVDKPLLVSPAPDVGFRKEYVPVNATAPSREFTAKLPPINMALKDSWKKKLGAELTEPELLAMPDAVYMNDTQLAFFKHRLQTMRQDLINNADETTEHLREDTLTVPDPADRATIEEEHALELRTRDRERKLLKKIQQVIVMIDSGEYGFCEETGEPIGVRRLLARPTATLSLEAQQRRELKQKLYGD